MTNKNMNNFEIDVSVQSGQWSSAHETLVQRAVQCVLQGLTYTIQSGEVSAVLADDNFVQALNNEYRGKNKPTNVLSFPQNEPDEIEIQAQSFLSLGDIILAFETIEREAEEQNKSFNDHLMHLIIHGTLHLFGYDHIDDQDAEKMEALEIELLEKLGVKNPYETEKCVA